MGLKGFIEFIEGWRKLQEEGLGGMVPGAGDGKRERAS